MDSVKCASRACLIAKRTFRSEQPEGCGCEQGRERPRALAMRVVPAVPHDVHLRAGSRVRCLAQRGDRHEAVMLAADQHQRPRE